MEERKKLQEAGRREAQEFRVRTEAGTEVRGWHWEADEARRNLCIITGMDEYALRYAPFAAWLAKRRINVWVLDALGQGRNAVSAERQEEWPEGAYAEQIKAIHEMNLLAEENGLPTVQMGHSMGSFMTQSLMERYPNGTDGIILCGSNGGQAGLMALGYGVARLLVHWNNRNRPIRILSELGLGAYAKAVQDRKTDFDWLSRDEENVRSYIADPYCGHENTGGFWLEFLKGMKEVWKKDALRRISGDERILIIAGAEDPVGRMGAGPSWLFDTYRSLGVRDVKLVLYPEMRHEILNERGYEQVWEDVREFVEGCRKTEG